MQSFKLSFVAHGDYDTFRSTVELLDVKENIPVASTMPSNMTTISNSSFSICARDISQKGLFSLISWEIMRGDTRKRRSSPVSKPMLMSVWLSGMNSPSFVCCERMSLARIDASTICEFRRSPTLNIKHILLSLTEITACGRTSASLLGSWAARSLRTCSPPSWHWQWTPRWPAPVEV